MKVKIKKLHPNAVIPTYAHNGDAGMDLTALSVEYDKENNCIEYSTGLAIEITEGYVGLLFPRSSVYKTKMLLTNSVGVIDSKYRGEIKLKFSWPGESMIEYQPGDRIGQLIILPYPKIEFEESEDLSETERGEGGYGSTGR